MKVRVVQRVSKNYQVSEVELEEEVSSEEFSKRGKELQAMALALALEGMDKILR